MASGLFTHRGQGTVDGAGHDPYTATLAIIGEAPGSEEVRDHAPFVGKSGWRLSRYLHTYNLKREWFWVDNVYPYQPPGNEIKAVPRGTLEFWISHLHQRIVQMKKVRCIVAVGNVSLYALTGKGQVNWRKGEDGITKLAGYVFTHHSLDGRQIPVIGVVHPAGALRRWQLHRQCMQDWAKVATVIFHGVQPYVKETITINPTWGDLNNAVKRVEAHGGVVGIDIENPKEKIKVGVDKEGRTKYKDGKPVTTCVGFGDSDTWAISVPTTVSYWQTETQLKLVWEMIRYVCELPNPKLGQNFGYDAWVLYRVHGILPRNWRWDTMCMEHALDSTAPLSLGRLASKYLWCDYWKDEAKSPEEAKKYTANFDTFQEYNGKDVTRMFGVFGQQKRLLEKHGMVEFYLNHYADLYYPALLMGTTGVRVDRLLAKEREVELFLECLEIQDRLYGMTGERLYTNVSLSDTAVKKYLYETCGYPVMKKRRGKSSTATASAGEVEVRKLMLKHKELMPVGELILDHRRKKKLSEFYSDARIDADSRVRCQYQLTTLAGRWKSKKSPIGTGTNAQNPDREIRDMFLADRDEDQVQPWREC